MRKIKYIRVVYLLLIMLSSINLDGQNKIIDSLATNIELSMGDVGESYNRIVVLYFTNEDYDKAFEYAELGIKYSKEHDNTKVMGNLTLLKAYIFLSWGLPQKAAVSFSNARKMGFDLNDYSLIVGGYHGIGRAYINMTLYDKAIKELKEGLVLALDSNFKGQAGVFYNALGMAYQEKEILDSALISFSLFAKFTEEMKDSLNLLFAYVNLGEINSRIGDRKKAAEYFSKAKILNKNIKNSQATAAIIGNMAELYYQNGMYDSSLVYCKESMRICAKNRFTTFQIENYDLLIRNHTVIGDSASTIKDYNSLMLYKDSVYNADKLNSISYLEAQYKIEKSIKESEILNQKLYNRSVFLYFSIAVIILISLLLILLYSRYKLKTKIHHKETKELNLTIDEKNRELVSKILSVDQSSKMTATIVKEIQQAMDKSSIEDVNMILGNLKSNLQKNKPSIFNWDDFKIHFQQVHPDFFNSIKKLNGNLTNNELRHCAYIKMNLSTKEIASFLNVSDRAIQTARYRIKKKLELSKEVDLFKFIQSI